MSYPIQTTSTLEFNRIFDRVIGHEGGYVNDPNDAGGETNWGITIYTARANGYAGSMAKMSREEAREIYFKAFWKRYKCDAFSPELAFQFFDACVNHGSGNASRMLQRAVSVVDDGVIGNITLAAIQRYSVADVLARFNAERIDFYTKLKNFNHFGKGWVRRIATNLRYAAQDTEV